MNHQDADVVWDIYTPEPLDKATARDGFDERIFMQDQIWIDANRKVHQISEMGHGHVANTYNMLLKKNYHQAAMIAPAREAFWKAIENGMPFDPNMFIEMTKIKNKDWLDSTPLMKALHRQIELNKTEALLRKESQQPIHE